MGRRKKEVVEIEATEELETSQDESAEIEANEAALLNDSQTRNISMAEIDAEEEKTETEEETLEVEAKEEQEKPKRQRRSRKKADEPASEEGTEITSAVAMTKNEKNLKKEMDAACKAIETSMEAMLKQWASVKEVTSSVSENLEKIANQVQAKTGQPLDDFLLPKKEEKPSFLVKFAICASVIATLFSVLSLTMSQSARQSILNAELSRTNQSQVASSQAYSSEMAMGAFRKDRSSKKR